MAKIKKTNPALINGLDKISETALNKAEEIGAKMCEFAKEYFGEKYKATELNWGSSGTFGLPILNDIAVSPKYLGDNSSSVDVYLGYICYYFYYNNNNGDYYDQDEVLSEFKEFLEYK